MDDLPNFIQTFINLPPFPTYTVRCGVEAAVLETFEKLKIPHIPYFCILTILYEGNIEWDRMLYICGDDEIPVVAFYSSNFLGRTVFVDCYGNLFDNELKLIQSFNHTKYYKYYNVKKVFNITPFTSDEQFLKCLAINYRMLGSTKLPKMLKLFYENLGAENAVKALKTIKNYYRVFLQLIRNIDAITEFKIHDSSEILCIKLYESKRKVETVIEVNMEKLSNEAAYAMFTKLMWRLNLENSGGSGDKERSISETIGEQRLKVNQTSEIPGSHKFLKIPETFVGKKIKEKPIFETSGGHGDNEKPISEIFGERKIKANQTAEIPWSLKLPEAFVQQKFAVNQTAETHWTYRLPKTLGENIMEGMQIFQNSGEQYVKMLSLAKTVGEQNSEVNRTSESPWVQKLPGTSEERKIKEKPIFENSGEQNVEKKPITKIVDDRQTEENTTNEKSGEQKVKENETAEIFIEQKLKKLLKVGTASGCALKETQIPENSCEQRIAEKPILEIVAEQSQKSTAESSLPLSLPESTFSSSKENYLIAMNRFFGDDVDFLTKCKRLAEKISQQVFRNSTTLSHFKNIVLWLQERLSYEYKTDEEVINEYQYLFNEVKKFDFKEFRYINLHSAVYHVYKHFDGMINMECFENYKRDLDSKIFENGTKNIIGKLIKTAENSKLLKDCFTFYFNFLPSKLFKKENLVYWQSTGSYQAYNFTTDEISGAQIKFAQNAPLSIVTIFGFLPGGGDMVITDGHKPDFQTTTK